MLIYLNDLDEGQGGATYFRDLNVAVKPKQGRAVCWTNTNPDGSVHRETLHAALPPEGEDAEKWVIQLWFRPYRMHKIKPKLEPLQTQAGVPLATAMRNCRPAHGCRVQIPSECRSLVTGSCCRNC